MSAFLVCIAASGLWIANNTPCVKQERMKTLFKSLLLTLTPVAGVKRLAAFVSVCLYLCVSVCLCLSVCVFVRTIKQKQLKLQSPNLPHG